MDHTMGNVNSSKSSNGTNNSVDVEWQTDPEWINLSSSTPQSVFPVGSKKRKQTKHKLGGFKMDKLPTFHFISTMKGGRFVVVDNQIFRQRQNTTSGYSYWACSIPWCNAWYVFDSQEKKIIQSCRNHSHEADISRKEYKTFISALKIAVKENPHLKPQVIYDTELEKARQQWRENNMKSSTNKEKPCLPSFEAVQMAMFSSRNAVLSAFSPRATRSEISTTEVEPTRGANQSRFTKSRDAKIVIKQKSVHSDAVLSSSSDFNNLEEVYRSEPDKDAGLSDFEEWLDDVANADIPMGAVSPSKRQGRSVFKKTPAKKVQELKLELVESEENSLWEGASPTENIQRQKNRKRPGSASVFTCPHCPYKSNRHFNVQRHERLAHSTKKPEFSCKECGTSYSLEYRLKLHVKAVHQGEGHSCHICARSFETMTGLKSHVVTKHKNDDPKVHHEAPPELTCSLCGRVFSTKSHLQKHTSTHVMIQPYRCYVCNKAFMEEPAWLLHQSHCTDEFTVQCCLCSAFVPTAQELMTHMDLVHGRAEYSCHCGKIFPWKKSLLTHQQKCSLFLAERSM